MALPVSRRFFLGVSPPLAAALGSALVSPEQADAGAPKAGDRRLMTGARAIVGSLQVHGVCHVFGIPGAQENELWDELKRAGIDYTLVTHEQSAGMMADGYARVTGRPGVVCIVPGPGVTNALTGIGEAKLDSVPLVVIVGDIAKGEHYRPFQVHDLPTVDMLRTVTKGVFEARCAAEVSGAVQRAFALAQSGEPGPTAVIVPYPALLEVTKITLEPPLAVETPFDAGCVERAIQVLSERKRKVGLYVGQGAMEHGELVTRVAEVLQAPVATSVSGKGVIAETHPLAVGWGYGPQGARSAEKAFEGVDTLLAIGVKFAEVSTGLYSNPDKRVVIHVDAERGNIGRILKADVPVHADAGAFLSRVLEREDVLRRPADAGLVRRIAHWKEQDARRNAPEAMPCGVDPMATIAAIRRALPCDGLFFCDVSLSEHWAAETFTVHQPRTYFNPVDNQAMGWAIPAVMGGWKARPDRVAVALTGDGCFLMTAMELATAAREGMGVKVFVLDDGTYKYMQTVQKPAYLRTTATVLPKLDFAAFAQAVGVGYAEIHTCGELAGAVPEILSRPGPVLVRVKTEYPDRKVRWIEAVKDRFLAERSTGQKIRMAGRLGARAMNGQPEFND